MKMLPVAILAGGQGTRLRPITERIPKALVEVNGQPFLAHQLRLLNYQGIDRVVMCTGHLGEMIGDWLGDGSRFGIRVSYSHDGKRQRGTAGAVAGALALLDDCFFVLYGDSYLPCDFSAVQSAFLKSGKIGLMTVFRNEQRWNASNVEFANGQILEFSKEKQTPRMQHIDYGLGLFHRSAFEGVHPNLPLDLATLYQDLLQRNELAAMEVQQRFFEVGSFSGIRDLEVHLSFSKRFLNEAKAVLDGLDVEAIDRLAAILKVTRDRGGRLFILGVGGSAANASHAVSDFRRVCGFESYAPTDNISELTARTNDDGWETVFRTWLAGCRLNASDAVLVLSVGGGDLERNLSPNLVYALQYARERGARILGIVGRDGGYTAQVADACVVVPAIYSHHLTVHTEASQAIIWHLLVSHPELKQADPTWESRSSQRTLSAGASASPVPKIASASAQFAGQAEPKQELKPSKTKKVL
jgi:D-sedoheptulose 7-phosphate isomerase